MITITQEHRDRLWSAAALSDLPAFDREFAAAGITITITPPAPPEKMVSLAEQIAYEAGDNLLPRDYTLAALQHVEKVVRDAPVDSDSAAYVRNAILKQLGADA